MSIAKVLLADDEKPFVENMIKLLKKREIDTVPAFNGKEALDRRRWTRKPGQPDV